jgi:hypothetical protein
MRMMRKLRRRRRRRRPAMKKSFQRSSKLVVDSDIVGSGGASRLLRL